MYLGGHYYHVYNRGCNREQIFVNADNYVFLTRRAKTFLTDYPLKVIAYCLMPNHYHFLLRPEEDSVLSRFIQRLFNSYTQAFNKQQKRSGTLFQGRAKSILVDTEEYIIYLVGTFILIQFELDWWLIPGSGLTAIIWNGWIEEMAP